MSNGGTTPTGQRLAALVGNWQVMERTQTVGPTPFPVIAGSPIRISICFSNISAGDLWISTDPGLTNPGGILLPANSTPLIFYYSRDGGLVGYPWYARAQGGGQSLSYIAVEFNEAYS